MVNQVQLGGHVLVEDYAVLGASVHAHQFCRIGESAMLGALAAITQDVAPFTIAHGFPARILKVNRINMERRGFSREQMKAVERAFRIVFRLQVISEKPGDPLPEKCSESSFQILDDFV